LANEKATHSVVLKFGCSRAMAMTQPQKTFSKDMTSIKPGQALSRGFNTKGAK